MISRKASVMLALIIWLMLNSGAFCSEADRGNVRQPFLSENLKIKAWIENGPSFIVTEQIRLVIEVSTATWFVRGTKISPLELEDALIPPGGQFAVNFVRHEQTIPWSVQQWTFLIYPLKEKSYQIPGLTVEVAIADKNGMPVTMATKTRLLTFSAQIPPELKDLENWVAVTRFYIHEHYSMEKEAYDVGDAITRSIGIEAEGLPAMMLPILEDPHMEGLAAYENPPELSDKTNRGECTGVRVETITYVIEKPGRYVIPGRVYIWWNLSAGQMETVHLPERMVTTQGFGELLPLPKKSPGFANSRIFRVAYLWGVIIIAFIIMVATYFYRSRKNHLNLKKPPALADLRRSLKRAVKNNDPQKALELLYRWFDHYGPEKYNNFRQFLHENGTLKEVINFDGFMERLYSNKPVSNALYAEMKSFSGLRRFMKADKQKWHLTVIGAFVNLLYQLSLLSPDTPFAGNFLKYKPKMDTWTGIDDPYEIPR